MSGRESSTFRERSVRNCSFDRTSLSLLHKVRGGDEAALEELCSRYWYPLYTWLLVTRLARSEADAQDLVQSFFAKMLAQGTLAIHAPERGRFRSYLLRCLKHQVIDQLRRPALALAEPAEPDADPLAQVEDTESADAAFEKAWAWELFETAKVQLHQTWTASDQGELFAAFAPFLEGNPSPEGLAAIGERFGLSHDNTRTRLHRLRKQLRELLTTLVIADLPDDATEAERSEEMRHFLEALLL
jgi:RNA polymerase sigma factor (sigma-70 family)